MRDFLFALVLFVTWTFSFSLGNLLIVGAILMQAKPVKYSKTLAGLLLIIVLFSFINIFLGIGNSKLLDSGSSSLSLFIPYLSMLMASFLIGSSMNEKIIRYLVLLTIVECAVVCWQFYTGKTGLWYNSYEINSAHSDLLYFTRPNGLSFNSSIVAQKVLISVWALFRCIGFGKNVKLIFLLILGVTSVVLFNRTIFIAVILGLLVSKELLKRRVKVLLLLISVPIVVYYGSVLFTQILRGADRFELETLDRYRIYREGLSYILENPILGNNSVKYFYLEGGRHFHLHNSYLELLASNGVVIGGLCLVLLFLLRRNYFVLPVIIYSFFQFGVFWGLSFMDIILFYDAKKRD